MHKYRYLFRLIVVCVFFMFLLACTNPKKASDSNFKAALDRHFQAHGQACVQLNGVDGKGFPLEVELGRPAWMGEGTLNLFEKQGLLASSELTKSVPDLSFMMSKRNREAKIRRYELTEAGKKYFKLDENAIGPGLTFCYGQRGVDRVVKWTEPAGAAGYTVSVVTYHYTMNDVPEWAKSAEVQREYPEIKNDLDGAGKAERQAQLVLTNQGWEVPAH